MEFSLKQHWWIVVLAAIGIFFILKGTGFMGALLETGWTQTTPSAQWQPRNYFAATVFDGKMWIMGGANASINNYATSYKNDVWYSTDGIEWIETTNDAQWSKRMSPSVLTFDGKIWIMGGRDDTGTSKNDVWYSTDGITWTQATASAPWLGRIGQTAVVYDNRMWIIGGANTATYTYFNDVWYSTDGVTWTQATASAPWGVRYEHSSVVYNNKMWVIGGVFKSTSYSDAWYSADGIDWIETIPSNVNLELRRFQHTSVAFDGKMWVIGGAYKALQNDYNRTNNLVYSTDGVTWTLASPGDWSPRLEHNTLVFNDRLWVLGGYAGPSGIAGTRMNDAWSVGYVPEPVEAICDPSASTATAPVYITVTEEFTAIPNARLDFYIGGEIYQTGYTNDTAEYFGVIPAFKDIDVEATLPSGSSMMQKVMANKDELVEMDILFTSELDADADGVNVPDDKCPGPAFGETDSSGCFIDGEACAWSGWGSYNGLCASFRCLNGICVSDMDLDGVSDSVDSCPNTFPVCPVDSTGCYVGIAPEETLAPSGGGGGGGGGPSCLINQTLNMTTLKCQDKITTGGVVEPKKIEIPSWLWLLLVIAALVVYNYRKEIEAYYKKWT